MYPVHLRGTGEGVAQNVGTRMLGTLAAVMTTQLAALMPGSSAPTHVAYSAAIVAAMLYSIALVASFALREPSGEWLPD